jgi:putative transposase
MTKIEYRNRLPHLAPMGATFFVTFRLADALPRSVISKMEEEYISERNEFKVLGSTGTNKRKIIAHEKRFLKIDSELDKGLFGECILKNKEIAGLIAMEIKRFDGTLYHLLSYCIMPNHVHLIFDTSAQLTNGLLEDIIPGNYVQLGKIIKTLKGKTARLANQFLGRRGTFWQKDYYDRYIRNDRQLEDVVNYIINNPIKAGLAQNWDDWPYTYLKL